MSNRKAFIRNNMLVYPYMCVIPLLHSIIKTKMLDVKLIIIYCLHLKAKFGANKSELIGKTCSRLFNYVFLYIYNGNILYSYVLLCESP